MSLLWHPAAKRVVIETAPQDLSWNGGGRKFCWHTTEGSSWQGAVSAYHANGDCPHFTIALVGGKRVLLQHLPLDRAASALKHPTGTVQTNRANVIQTEIVGFARGSGQWDDQMYHYLHLLAIWVGHNFRVPMTTDVHWRFPARLGPDEWYKYSGHLGHMHVPYNDHGDPGVGFHIGKVLKGVK